MMYQQFLWLGIVSAVVAASIPAYADLCGDYPNCTKGSICIDSITYVCVKRNNSCGPWSAIPGCPKDITSRKEDKEPSSAVFIQNGVVSNKVKPH